MMKDINVQELIKSCDFVQRITTNKYIHSSCRLFDSCMRAFDNSKLPAQAVEFKVFLNAPVMQEGYAQFFRDGSVKIRLHPAEEYGA